MTISMVRLTLPWNGKFHSIEVENNLNDYKSFCDENEFGNDNVVNNLIVHVVLSKRLFVVLLFCDG